MLGGSVVVIRLPSASVRLCLPIPSLPIGPLKMTSWEPAKCDRVDKDTLSQCYVQWVCELEQQALSFLSPTHEQEVALCGRHTGPRATWRVEMGPRARTH